MGLLRVERSILRNLAVLRLLWCRWMPDDPLQAQQLVLTDIPTRRIAVGGVAALLGAATLLRAEPTALHAPAWGLVVLAALVGLAKATTA